MRFRLTVMRHLINAQDQDVRSLGIEVGLTNVRFDNYFLQGLKPIHVAAHRGSLPLVQCLVEEFGAEPLRDRTRASLTPHLDNKTAFEIAVDHGHISVVRYLVAKFPGEFQTVRQMSRSFPFS